MTPRPRPDDFIVAVLDRSGRAVGCGVLLGPRQLVTCAHVVNTALDRAANAQDRPTARVFVEFPLLRRAGARSMRLEAEIDVWLPPAPRGTDGEDLACLVLQADPTAIGALPGRLAADHPPPGRPVRLFGYPGEPPRPAGAWVSAVVRGMVGGQRIQLDSQHDSALRVQPGYSGTPLCDESTGLVAGLLVAAAPGLDGHRDGYAINVDRIRKAWPRFFGPVTAPAPRERPPGAAPRSGEQLTVLHVSDLRIGRNSLFGGNGGATRAHEDGLFAHLRADLDSLRADRGVAPDLIVVTGDLTESGLPSELARGMEFLGALAEATGVPRRHVAIVPGNHDVNRLACEAYFAEQASAEREAREPYTPKWRDFMTAFQEFYAAEPAVSFAPEEQWTLFEMPELRLVVAGLNSTMAESHRPGDHYGWLTERQVRWFAERLRAYRELGWLRLGAVHHNVAQGCADDEENLRDADLLDRVLGSSHLLNLLLHGHPHSGLPHLLTSGLLTLATGGAAVAPADRPAEVPNQYQLLALKPGGVTRYARQYLLGQRRWVGDPRVSATGFETWAHVPYELTGCQVTFTGAEPDNGNVEGEPPSGPRGADPRVPVPRAAPDGGLFAQVVRALRARHQHAQIEERPEAGYLRVANPVPTTGAVHVWPVGVIDGAVDQAAIDHFIDDVHVQFEFNGPMIPSELVYTGPPAPPELVDAARRRGVLVRSFINLQGLIDLRDLVQRQTARLAGDPVHPSTLYIPQRYRLLNSRGQDLREDLAGEITKWLGAKSARLIIVLGDFGRGKTSLLRQLARTLPAELPDLQPILVELRNLNKHHTVDELLAQFLIENNVEEISAARIHYMVASGRLALLFDGFDELEQRVGYDNAAEYLQRLLESVTEDAKLVLTSRTQHFASTEQVRTAIGARVANLPGSRIVSLEAFSAQQIMAYLVHLHGGDVAAAQARFQLLDEVKDLLDLAQNPRMLAFIVELDERRLREVQRREGRLSAAELYRELIGSWLKGELDREQDARLRRFDQQRRDACDLLAERLWSSGRTGVGVEELTEVAEMLTALTDLRIRTSHAAHVIGTSSLLVRTDDGEFSFVHQSVMEWLVADMAAEALRHSRPPAGLLDNQASDLMVDFFVDLAGPAAASAWARKSLRDPEAPEAAKQNALKVHLRTAGLLGNPQTEQSLVGVDLRSQDLTGRDLRGADLREANLRGMRLLQVDFTGADLDGADLSGVRLVGGSLRGARLTGSRWELAAVVGDVGLDAQAQEHLQDAAIPGRDPAVVQIAPGGAAAAVAVSPDGRFLAVARTNVVELVDRASGRTLRTFTGHAGFVAGVAFAPDGRRVASVSDDRTARVWDVFGDAAPTVLTGHDGIVTAVAFSPDGRLLATGSHDRLVYLWDTETGSIRATLTGHGRPISGIAFSPDGRLLATASHDRTARIWKVANGRTQQVLKGHSGLVTAVAFAPGGNRVATASQDRTARIWEVGTGTQKLVLVGHTDAVSAVAFHPAGRRVATASYDATVQIWDAASGRRQSTLAAHTGAVRSLAQTRDGALLISASADQTVRIWDVPADQLRSVISGTAESLSGVAFSPDGRTLLTVSADGPARAWDVTTGRLRGTFAEHAARAAAVALSPAGDRIAIGLYDHTVQVWDVNGGSPVVPKRELRAHSGVVSAAAISPDGTMLATASDDDTARVWTLDAETGPLLLGHDGAVTAIAFAAGVRRVATAADDRTVRVWNVDTGQATATMSGHSGFITAVAFSADGRQLAGASYDSTARIWNAGTGVLRHALEGHTGPVTAVAFCRDGRLVATASRDRTARIWNARTGRLVSELTGHAGFVTGVAFSPDGRLLATVSADRTARIWDVATGREHAALLGLRDEDYAVLLPDGSYKLEGDARDTLWWSVRLCRFEPGELDGHVPGLTRVDPGTVVVDPAGGTPCP
ncbi:pentapeptide repeat-containing protein [Catellatospora sp. NPDC049609]|uniref:pentapeptide repeat-containing protein n=1 Tax=Catellatospora sp. NPDC049609 TaxID=3155505 RepID=UPI00341DBCA6